MKNKKQPIAVTVKAQRTFSTEFKRAKVAEINAKIVSVAEVARAYGVSRSAIYKWIDAYAPRQKAVQTVVQLESEQQKTLLLRERVEQLEGMLGRKQLELEYLHELLVVSSDELGVDLKKTFDIRRSKSFGKGRDNGTGL
jgi:transposase-like protein